MKAGTAIKDRRRISRPTLLLSMAEKPLRTKEEDDHHHNKAEHFGDISQKGIPETLHETQQKTPGNRSGNGPQPPDDHHDQGLEDGMHPQEGVHIE